jgi:hypothetical protein
MDNNDETIVRVSSSNVIYIGVFFVLILREKWLCWRGSKFLRKFQFTFPDPGWYRAGRSSEWSDAAFQKQVRVIDLIGCASSR